VSFIVLYDSNVLYPNILRNLLIRVAQDGLVQAKWTDQILDEVFRNVKQNRPNLDHERLDRTQSLMREALPDVLVIGYEPLIEMLELPDQDDRHVLAAAIKARAQVIVTDNFKHFPASALASWEIEAQGADEFVLNLIDLDQQTVYGAVQRLADSLKNPPLTVDDVLDSLERSGLVESVIALRG
jgi:predicted nucleic acid-binding protein